MPAKNLTPKQERFAAEYLIDSNATQAAIRAGYSARTADRIGAELLGKPWVSAAVATGRAAVAERIDRTVDAVMADLRRVGLAAEQAGDWGPAIRALELEAKHLGAFTERGLHSMNMIGPDWRALLGPTPQEVGASVSFVSGSLEVHGDSENPLNSLFTRVYPKQV